MKYFFSLFLLSPYLANAGLINIIHESNFNRAKIVKNIFNKQYMIPEKLISIKSGLCIENIDERFLNICITKKGELLQLSSNIHFIRKSLKTFNTPKNNEEL